MLKNWRRGDTWCFISRRRLNGGEGVKGVNPIEDTMLHTDQLPLSLIISNFYNIIAYKSKRPSWKIPSEVILTHNYQLNKRKIPNVYLCFTSHWVQKFSTFLYCVWFIFVIAPWKKFKMLFYMNKQLWQICGKLQDCLHFRSNFTKETFMCSFSAFLFCS